VLAICLFLIFLVYAAWQRSTIFNFIGLNWNIPNAPTFQRAIYAVGAGGLGGATFSLWSLLDHYCRKKDFDEKWNLWYIFTPISGSLIGIATFAVIIGGLLVLGGSLTLENNWAVFALCYVAGFSSKRVLWKLDSIAEEIFQGKPTDQPQPQNTQTQPTP
jgi:hypothetical protein